jgi:hypothetical protein
MKDIMTEREKNDNERERLRENETKGMRVNDNT